MQQQHQIRIGALVPAGNVVLAREFQRLQPARIESRVVGFSYPAASSEFCADLLGTAAAPMADLRAWGAQIIFLGCTAASMRCAGPAFTLALQQLAGVPVITAAAASLQAFAAMGVERVTVATPYGANGNAVISEFLATASIGVAAIGGLAFDSSPALWAAKAPTLPADALFEFAMTLDSADAQALYLPCTAVGSLDAIQLYEQRTGKLGFSSVQAGYWACLQRLGVRGPADGLGRLLSSWPG